VVRQETTAAESEAARGPLQVAPFRYLWLNNITYAMVMNAVRFVYGWVVLDALGRSESAQGLAIFVLGAPTLLLVLPAGVWADRMNRRRLLLLTQLVSAGLFTVTGVLIAQGRLSMGLVVISAGLIGSVMAVGSPVRSSLIPELLPARLLYSGIALNALAMTMSMVAGAVVAQLVGDAFGFEGVFFYLAGLLVLGSVAIFRMETPPTRISTVGARVSMRAAVSEGLRFVAADPALRTLFAMLALSGGVMSALMFATLQAFVKEDLGRDAGDAAPLFAVIGVGLAVSSFVVMRKGDMDHKGTIFLRSILFGTAMLTLMGRTTAYWQLLVLGLLMGLTGGFFINMNQGLIQSNTPPELMGRVMGFFTLVQQGLTPVGALVIGVLADVIGPADAITLCAGLAFVATLVTYMRAEAIHEIT
jgi:MFS family permease